MTRQQIQNNSEDELDAYLRAGLGVSLAGDTVGFCASKCRNARLAISNARRFPRLTMAPVRCCCMVCADKEGDSQAKGEQSL